MLGREDSGGRFGRIRSQGCKRCFDASSDAHGRPSAPLRQRPRNVFGVRAPALERLPGTLDGPDIRDHHLHEVRSHRGAAQARSRDRGSHPLTRQFGEQAMSIHVQPPKTYGNFVGGKQVDAAGGATFQSTNPTSGSHWGNFALSSAADVDLAVKNAHAAFSGAWGKLSPTERGKRLTVWGEKIASQAERIGTIESTQNGKLLAEMRLQSTIAEDWLRYFGGLADKIEGSVIPLARQSVLNYTLREPLGVIGVITAWNSPTFLNIMA